MTSGLDNSRVAMVLAVLAQHGQLKLHNHDVFCSTVGGAKLTEPATDLAIAISLASATYSRPAPTATIAIGELGLAGELRRVRDLPQRLAEAARLGFKYALVPSDRTSTGPRTTGQTRVVDGMKVIDVPDVASVMRLLDFRGPWIHAAPHLAE